MPTNVYFTQGTRNEQFLVEDLIIESLKIFGQEMFYIPRTLVAKDEILGEDRLSKFTSNFPIEMYFENVDSFAGQGAFIQKFGLMMEQSATLVVARRRWEQLVGRYGATQIPTRPNEGDLLYFPLTKGLFEIKFVQHQDPFYQLGKLYVYKLQIELFQYSSEHIDTGIAEVDAFESLKTFSTNTTRNPTGRVVSVDITDPGSGYIDPPTVTVISGGAEFEAELGLALNAGKVKKINITKAGKGYKTEPLINISPPPAGGTIAVARARIDIDIDVPDSFGDNNKFAQEAGDVLFSESNPFGEITNTPRVTTVSYDSTTVTEDNTIITTDNWG